MKRIFVDLEWKKNLRPWSWFAREEDFRFRKRQLKVKEQNEIRRLGLVSVSISLIGT